MRKRIGVLFTALICAVLMMSACGGGGSTASSGTNPNPQPTPVPSGVLAWEPPQTFVDETQLDPSRDLAYYEIYLRQDPNFSDSDVEAAQVGAVSNGAPVTSFDLANIPPELMKGGGGFYLAVRAVGVDGMKSDFSEPIAWSAGNV